MNDVITDFIRLAHMAAFAVGIGAAAFLETAILRRVLRRIDGESLDLLQAGHRIIRGAIVGLWLSGLALLAIRVGVEGNPLSAKLMTKLAVVTLLTVNMLLLGRYVLPRLAAHRDGHLRDIPRRTVVRFGAIGGFSAGCWTGALLLGSIGLLKSLDAGTLALLFSALLLAAIATGMTVAGRKMAEAH